jgi:hypothetical protein
MAEKNNRNNRTSKQPVKTVANDMMQKKDERQRNGNQKETNIKQNKETKRFFTRFEVPCREPSSRRSDFGHGHPPLLVKAPPTAYVHRYGRTWMLKKTKNVQTRRQDDHLGQLEGSQREEPNQEPRWRDETTVLDTG